MGVNARQRLILSSLGGGAYIEVKDLAAELGVDVSTVRRDLQTLTRHGLVERLHGGVRLPTTNRSETSIITESHAAIAAAARRLLRGHERILLNAGPITDRLVPLLFDLAELTVITNDLRAADTLAQQPSITVHAVGGDLRDAPAHATTSGPEAAAFIERQHADWSFVEVQGIHSFSGFTTSTPWAVGVKRALLASASKRCVLAPSQAFGIRCVGYIANISEADLIITDEALTDDVLPPFQGRVLRAAMGEEFGAHTTSHRPSSR